MDELGGFEPTDTTGFIQIESIRIKKSVLLDKTTSWPNADPHSDQMGSSQHPQRSSRCVAPRCLWQQDLDARKAASALHPALRSLGRYQWFTVIFSERAHISSKFVTVMIIGLYS